MKSFLVFILFFSQNLVATEPHQHKIAVFIHVCTLADWKEILNEQLLRLQTSGLYDRADEICMSILGKKNLKSFLNQYPKIKIVSQTSDMTLYERSTLLYLWLYAQQNPDSYCLYFHTKGVKRNKSQNVRNWRHYMEYFVIDQWQTCLFELQDHDICGVNWQESPKPHFSGNFWWAKGSYITTLPGKIGSDYYDTEMWIGSCRPKMKCLHSSGINHYALPYPETEYVK